MSCKTAIRLVGVARNQANGFPARLLDRLMEITGGIRVSAHVPAAAGTPAKQEAVIRLGNNPDMTAPIWENIAIIPDEITKASAGQIVLTAVMLHAVKILRVDGYYKLETQHA